MDQNKTTIDNVKIVFFDVLAKQVESLIKQRDSITDNSLNSLDSQFELLRSTLVNVENLVGNVLAFENNGQVQDIKIDNQSPVETGGQESNEQTNKFIVGDTNTENNETTEETFTPLIPVSQNEITLPTSTAKIEIPSTSDDTEEQATEEEDMEEDEDLDDAYDNEDDAMDEEEPQAITLPTTNATLDDQEETPEDNNEAEEGPTKYYKTSDNQVKAIIVNQDQLQKLANSKETQKGMLDFGAAAAPTQNNNDAEIEQLFQQANELYKQGNAIEAEKIYQRIRELSQNNKNA